MRAHLPLVLAIVCSLSVCAAQAQGTSEPKAKARSLGAVKAEFKKEYPHGILVTKSRGDHDIMVLVKKDCVITPPAELGMLQGVQGRITWKVDRQSAGKVVLFTNQGIDPKNKGAWKKEFNAEQAGPGTTKWSWFNTNPHDPLPANQKRKMGYSVELTQDGKKCAPLDPIIINDY